MLLPGAHDLRFAVSDPCFEFWLLLHFEFTTAPFDGYSEVRDRLKSHWPEYKKGDAIPIDLFERLPKAVVGA